MVEVYEVCGVYHIRLETSREDCEIQLADWEAKELLVKLLTELENA